MARRTLSEPFSFQRIIFPISVTDDSEGHFRSSKGKTNPKIKA